MTRCDSSARIYLVLAGIAHLVERHLAKVEVASSSLVARSKLRKSPKAMKKALGLFSCARQTFSSLSHRNRCAGFRREPCTFPIRQDGDFPLEFSKVKTGCFREKKLFSKQTGKRERRVPCVIQINRFQNFLKVLKS